MAQAYIPTMRAKASTVRKFAAVFMAAILVLAMEPVALAMPAPHSAAMQTTHGASDGTAGCDQSMPKHERGTPCKHMAVCLGMLNSLAMAVAPVDAVSVLPLASTYLPSWYVRDLGPGITHQPDNPPPIA
jgi:hypothetical protein